MKVYESLHVFANEKVMPGIHSPRKRRNARLPEPGFAILNIATTEDQSVQEELYANQANPTEQAFLRLQQRNGFVTPDQVTVVIPVLNEREAIAKVLDDLKGKGFDNVLVVDGYSEDGTAEIARSKGAVVLQQRGPGKAGALVTAFDAVSTPYLVVMDGDYTYSAADVMRLLPHAAEFDEVIGARTKGRQNIPGVNRFGNWVISKAFKLLFGEPITDVLSGMYLLRTETAREVQITSTSFDVEVEIAGSIASSGRITQVPIGYGERLGTQKLRPRDGGRIIGTLFWMAYYCNPLLLFGALVSLCAVPAAGILAWALYEKLALGIWHSGYALLGVMLLLIATQGAVVSLASLLTKRSENRIMLEFRKTLGRR
jgi:dolichol-phosphate hexosyltransferase